MLVLGRSFQPNLKLVNKTGACLSEAFESCSTLGWAPCLTHKQYTKPERPVGNKHSSFLGPKTVAKTALDHVTSRVLFDWVSEVAKYVRSDSPATDTVIGSY